MSKERLNELIDAHCAGGTGVNPPDYCADAAAMRGAVEALKERGWALAVDAPGRWQQATKFLLRRGWVEVRTRTPEHQALVERRGEVKPGENTYETTVRQEIHSEIGGAWREREQDAGLVLDSPLLALAPAMVLAGRRGERPGRLRDITWPSEI